MSNENTRKRHRFEIGMLVRLRSGGAQMVVSDLDFTTFRATCIWHTANGDAFEKSYPFNIIEPSGNDDAPEADEDITDMETEELPLPPVRYGAPAVRNERSVSNNASRIVPPKTSEDDYDLIATAIEAIDNALENIGIEARSITASVDRIHVSAIKRKW